MTGVRWGPSRLAIAIQWEGRTRRMASRALERYLAGQLSCRAWITHELRWHAAKRELWAAEAARDGERACRR